MSRIGKVPVLIPNSIEVTIKGLLVTVTGKQGQIDKEFAGNLSIEHQENSIIVKPLDEVQQTKALWGTARSIIANMVKGANEGFVQELEINGVGYKAALQKQHLNLSVGKSHDVRIEIPNYIKVELPKPTAIILRSIDKEKLGQFTALIIKQCPPEPYKGKGIKKKNQFILRKEGKKTK